MNVFKYRGGNEKDIDALINNYFYSPLAKHLNDPFETFVDSESYKKEIDLLIKIAGKKNSQNVIKNRNHFIKEFEELLDRLDNNVGYYSLSKNNLNEMMWSLYANSHKGFCIEYDLDKLLITEGCKYRYKIDIQYQNKPSIIKVKDFNNLKKDKGKSIIIKKSGCKSKAWLHEEEVRIITDTIGKNSYNINAVIAIYFGVNMNDRLKQNIVKEFRSTPIQFFQMELKKDSYKLKFNPYNKG